jgi:hypothetical protein
MSHHVEDEHALIERYVRAASAHGRATNGGDSDAANRAHDQVAQAYSEIRSRGSGVQDKLLPLLDDPDPGVRSWAGAHALEFSPKKGERALRKVAGEDGLIAFSAEMTLETWKAGTLRFP